MTSSSMARAMVEHTRSNATMARPNDHLLFSAEFPGKGSAEYTARAISEVAGQGWVMIRTVYFSG